MTAFQSKLGWHKKHRLCMAIAREAPWQPDLADAKSLWGKDPIEPQGDLTYCPSHTGARRDAIVVAAMIDSDMS